MADAAIGGSNPDRQAGGAKPDFLLIGAVVVMCATMLLALYPLGRPALPRRYAEVTPGKLFRGARPDSTAALRRLRDQDHIRTVIDLTDRESRKHAFDESQAAASLGLRYKSFPMPGNGTGDDASLDAAADAIADEQNQPLLFHCAAGKQRSNAALAAYRMKHCGWTIEQAFAELETKYELDRKHDAALCARLRDYYERHLHAR